MSETTHSLPIARLRESRSQPRKTYNPVKLQELADSIKAQGVMQPIVVRPLPEDSPLRFESAASCALVFDYEIVFGHRRSRAANLAGLEFIPTFIRDMDDEQVALAQIHENLERDDVHPIEEADAFMTLINRHHVTADQLVAQTGKSRSYIYGQIKMARKLGPEVREACLANVIGSEIALLIARYCPSHKLQPRALQAVMAEEWADGKTAKVALSSRRAKQALRDQFCIRISAAPFNSDRGDLVAGEVACNTCPKLAGNDPDLADEFDADVCTDGGCYRAKCDAHLSLAMNEARAAGATVIEGDAAATLLPYDGAVRPFGHVLLSDTSIPNVTSEAGETKHLSYRDAMIQLGDAAPQPVFIVHPHKPGVLVACLPRGDAERVKALAAGESQEESNQEAEVDYDPLAGIPESEWPFATHADQLEAATFEAAVQRTERTSYELLMVCRALAMDRYGFDDKLHRAMAWHDELHQALTDEGPDGEPKEAEHSDEESFVMARLSSCSPDELARFATLVALQCHPLGWGAEKRASLREMTDHYCIDVAAIAAPTSDDIAADDEPEADHPLPHAARAAESADAGAADSVGSKQPAAQAPEAAAAPAALEQSDDAGSAGGQATAVPKKTAKSKTQKGAPPAPEQKDDAGPAGVERDPRVPDMFADEVPA